MSEKYINFLFLYLQGYTIPLDKRLAADGRGLQDHTINDNFAKLAQALYTADREVSPSWFLSLLAVCSYWCLPACNVRVVLDEWL